MFFLSLAISFPLRLLSSPRSSHHPPRSPSSSSSLSLLASRQRRLCRSPRSHRCCKCSLSSRPPNSEATPSSLAVDDGSEVADMVSSAADRARRNPLTTSVTSALAWGHRGARAWRCRERGVLRSGDAGASLLLELDDHVRCVHGGARCWTCAVVWFGARGGTREVRVLV